MSPEELIRACIKSGDAAVWEEFVERFHRLISVVVMRTARRWGENSPQTLDDLIQDTYLKLCADRFRLLQGFEPRHPDAVFGYLKVLTANVVHDHFRRLRSAKRGSGRISGEAELPEGKTGGRRPGDPQSIEQGILISEIDACLQSCGKDSMQQRDRRIFWLYYRQGLSARAIASLPSIGLSTKGVESTILRLTRFVRSELAERRANQELRQGSVMQKEIPSAETF